MVFIPISLLPDRVHERVDVAGGLGAEVDGVGVLVHIERQDRGAAGERVTMIGRPLIDKLAGAPSRRTQRTRQVRRLKPICSMGKSRACFRPCAIPSTCRAMRRAWTASPSHGESASPMAIIDDYLPATSRHWP